MKQVLSLLACGTALAFAGPAAAQDDGAPADEITADEAGSDETGPASTSPDGDETDVNLDAIDALLGNTDVTGGASPEDTAEDAEPPDGDDPAAGEEREADESDETEPSDLDRAYAAYASCASAAGEAIEARGFSMDIIGEEALLRCSGERAAYVNAFYFSMLPRYSAEGEDETAIRARAERLAAATDRFLMIKVGEEAEALRVAREAEAPAEVAEAADEPNPDDTDDGAEPTDEEPDE